MKRKLIYLFIAFAAAILPAHAQKYVNIMYRYGNKATRSMSE